MIDDSNKEFYETTEDFVENFDQLNERYRNNTDWIIEENVAKTEENQANNSEINRNDSQNIIKDDLQLLQAFRNLYTPSEMIFQSLDSEIEYKEKQTDPYQRIINIKDGAVGD